MARKGEVIENPISGETIVFLQTAEDTAGALLQVDLFVAVEGGERSEHLHPAQEERFIVKRGEMTLRSEGREIVLRPGDEAVVPSGTPHAWWNSGDGELNAIMEARPAGRLEDLYSTLFGLAKTGRADPLGNPGILQRAVTRREFRDTFGVVDSSPLAESYVLPVVAAFGRSLGVRGNRPYPRRARVNRGMEIWRAEGTSLPAAV